MTEDNRRQLTFEAHPEKIPADPAKKLAAILAILEPGKIVCISEDEMPEIPEDWDDTGYFICKVQGDGLDAPAPFFLIGLEVDEETIKAAAVELIEGVLKGKVTRQGFPH